MKILVIEDENSLRELIARALLKEQYVVEVASTYNEAWEKLNMFSYDCVLLDIMLPEGGRKGVERHHHFCAQLIGRQGRRT